MSRVGSSLRRLLFVEVRADPPSANGIFARNVRQIDQEALLRISYFPPRPRTKKAESARQCPNLDGALPTNVLANTFPFSLHEGRIFRNEKSGRGIRCRSIVSSKVSSSRPVHSPETLPVRFCCCREVVCDFRPLPAGANSQPFRQAERNRVCSNCRGEKWKKNSTISSSRAQPSLLELPRREMEHENEGIIEAFRGGRRRPRLFVGAGPFTSPECRPDRASDFGNDGLSSLKGLYFFSVRSGSIDCISCD
mgnify:CR=1 FL=1